MGLLLRSSLRHMRRHSVQTGLTLGVVVLVTALLSVIFHFVFSFQALLREDAIETVGSYHYHYYVRTDYDSAVILEWMAEELGEDSWFSDVSLIEEDGELHLFLTVASPGIFMSKIMEKKLDEFDQRFHSEYESVMRMGSHHNHDLLVSCFDLNRENGIYSFLLIFLFVFSVIAGVSALMLASVFDVSASQRERDFALLASLGAEGRQIKGIVWMESVIYILMGIPGGYLMSLLLFMAGKPHLDTLLYALDRYPPMKLVISPRYTAVMVVCTVGVILLSGLKPARKAASVSPMALLSGREDMLLSDREAARQDKGKIWGRLGTEVLLAYKSHIRYKRRFRPIFGVLATTFALCFVLTGMRTYALQAMEISNSGLDYNMSVELYSDDLEALDELAEALTASSGHTLDVYRTARFEMHPPWPLSPEAEATNFLGDIRPDVLLVGVKEEMWREICSGSRIFSEPEDGMRGIFWNRDCRWSYDDIYRKGKPYSLKKDDVFTLYNSIGEEAGQEGFDIRIVGVVEEVPLPLDTEQVSRIVILVREDVFLQLEPLRPFPEMDSGLHHVSLRGLCENSYDLEERIREQIDTWKGVSGTIQNLERVRQSERAVVDGFRYLCGGLIALLALAAVCGNFTVSWSVAVAREKEFAMLSSIGMTLREVRKMRNWELFFQIALSAAMGLPAGILFHGIILKIYSTEYLLDWHFPWPGLCMGTAVMLAQILVTELATKKHINYSCSFIRLSE